MNPMQTARGIQIKRTRKRKERMQKWLLRWRRTNHVDDERESSPGAMLLAIEGTSIQLPPSDIVDRSQLLGMARTPERHGDARLVQCPAHCQITYSFAVTLVSKAVEAKSCTVNFMWGQPPV